MKKIFAISLLVLAFFYANGQQVPYGFNYQSVVRDAIGLPITNSAVKIRLSIVQGIPTGTVLYEEEHITTTNQFGLVNLIVGNGTKTGGSLTFDVIDWAAADHYILVEVDNNGTWATLGTGKFQSVPYAVAADNALKIQNQKVSPIAPNDAQFLKFNALTQEWEPSFLQGANGGTVITVTALGPISIIGDPALDPQITINQAGAIQDGYLSSQDWNIFDTKLDLNSLAGGDLSGTFNAITIIGIQGNPLSAQAPGIGQVLQWSGAAWVPSSVGATLTITGLSPLSVSGTSSEPILSIGQAGSTTDGYLSATDYAAFQLKLDPTSSFGGDVSGNYNSISVNSIGGVGVSTGGALIGQVMMFDGLIFTPQNIPPAQFTTITGINGATVSGSGLSYVIDAPNLTAGSGIQIAGNQIINTAQNIPITLTGGNNIAITGSGNDYTIAGTSATLTSNTANVTVNGLNIEIGTADGTNFGLLSPTDFSTFNNKLGLQPTITGINNVTVTGAYPNYTVIGSNSGALASNTANVTVNGLNIEIGTADGTNFGLLSPTDFTAFNNKLGIQPTITGINNVTVTGAYPNYTVIGSNSGALASNTANVTVNGLNIEIGTADGTNFGLLSPTDFTAFNNKLGIQPTITGINNVTVTGAYPNYTVIGSNSGALASNTANVTVNGLNIEIGTADGTNFGLLGPTDFTAFNNKLGIEPTITGINNVTVTGAYPNYTVIGSNSGALASNTANVTVNGLNIEIGTADGTNFGLLSPTDFTTFNNKLGIEPTITGINNVTVTGAYPNYTVIGSNSGALTSNTANVTVNGLNIEIGTADGTNFGLLSPTDFTAFNNKLGIEPTITGINNVTVTGVYPNYTVSGASQQNSWNVGGNLVTGIQNFGTLDNFDLPFITNNIERIRISNTGNIRFGGTGTEIFTIAGMQTRILQPATLGQPSLQILSGNDVNNVNLVLGRSAPEGNIGIAGTSAPQFLSDAAVAGDVVLRSSGASNNLVLAARSIGGNIIFATGATDTPRMIIRSAVGGGRIGINIANPNEEFVVGGSTSVTGIGYFGTIIGNNLSGASGSIITVDGVGKMGLGSLTNSQWVNTTLGTIFYNNGAVGIGTDSPFGQISAVTSGTTLSAGFFQTTNPASSASTVYSLTNGTGRAGQFQIFNATSTSTALYVNSNATGKVADFVGTGGVGISSDLTVGALSGFPGSIVTVDGFGKLGLGIPSNISTQWVSTTNGIYYSSNIGVNGIEPGTGTGVNIKSVGNSTKPIRVEYSGGSNFPLFEVDQGSGGNGNLMLYDNAGIKTIQLGVSTPSFFNGSGNLGVGTISPNEKLTVKGNSSVTGTGYFSTISGLALNGAPAGSVVTVDGTGKLGFGSLQTAAINNWTSTTGGITFSNDAIAIGVATTGGAALKVNGDISGKGQVIASSTMMPTGTAATTFSVIYKQRIYIPLGTASINGSINTYKYLSGGTGIIQIRIGAITTNITATSSNPNAFEAIPNIDVSTLAGSYQTVEILGQADIGAEGVMVQSFLLTSNN